MMRSFRLYSFHPTTLFTDILEFAEFLFSFSLLRDYASFFASFPTIGV